VQRRVFAVVVVAASTLLACSGVSGNVAATPTVPSITPSATPSASPTPTLPPSPTPAVDPAERAIYLKCKEKMTPLLDSLSEVDSRLSVGVAFAEYGDLVGDAHVAYDRIPFGRLDSACVLQVGVPLEDGLNDYINAQNEWNRCIQNFGCDIDSIDPDLQRSWKKATHEIAKARQELHALKPRPTT
jgi:hypothetical protein